MRNGTCDSFKFDIKSLEDKEDKEDKKVVVYILKKE